MPTTPQRDNDPQSSSLSAIREGQAAVIDVLRVWADIGQQLTRDLRLPIARIDLNEAVDRVFDVAEQTLAAQREFALTVAGGASRQIDIAVDTAAETIDTAVEAVTTTAETVEGTPKAEPPKPDRRTLPQPVTELAEWRCNCGPGPPRSAPGMGRPVPNTGSGHVAFLSWSLVPMVVRRLGRPHGDNRHGPPRRCC